jgi:hypothetical protein
LGTARLGIQEPGDNGHRFLVDDLNPTGYAQVVEELDGGTLGLTAVEVQQLEAALAAMKLNRPVWLLK